MSDTARSGAVSDSERIVLIVGAMAVLAAGVPALAWDRAQEWLLARQVLLPATGNPLWLLPGGQVGVDAPRLLVGAGVLLAVLGLLVYDARRRRNRDEEGWR